MLVHEALWVFAESQGSIYAKDYARKRMMLAKGDRTQADQKWLLRPGGATLRKYWMALSQEKRVELMLTTPDPTFQLLGTGIIDGRALRKTQIKRSTNMQRENLTLHSGEGFDRNEEDIPIDQASRLNSSSEVQVKLLKLSEARSRYFNMKYKESLAKLQGEYNRGSLAGVIEAATIGVENAILYSRSSFERGSSEEAFQYVAMRVARIFGSMKGIASFAPEPSYDNEDSIEESDKFAYSEYRTAAENVRTAFDYAGRDEDPDRPLLPSQYHFFKTCPRRRY